jgi:peptidoglycan/xylan/chitin deacetylase (PgdA/CDA1 family)
VALTFDDGPDPIGTPGTLTALDRYGARATFFVLVERARRWPELVRDAVAAGHELALHGLDHRRLTGMEPAAAGASIAAARCELEDLAGAPIRLFRPPFGAQSLRTFRAARRAGLDVVVWSEDPRDWEDGPADDVAARAVEACRPGAVVLLHDGRADAPAGWTPRPDRWTIAERVLAGLASEEIRAVTVSQLCAQGRAARSAWFRP